jgi:hypothetical protein
MRPAADSEIGEGLDKIGEAARRNRPDLLDRSGPEWVGSKSAKIRRAALPAKPLRQLWFAGALALIAASMPQGRSFVQKDSSEPVFVDTPCSLPNVTPEVRPRLRCGTVSVPQNYHDPDAGRFKLAIVVVRSAQQPDLPDPVVYINGGPGSPLTIYADQQARVPDLSPDFHPGMGRVG